MARYVYFSLAVFVNLALTLLMVSTWLDGRAIIAPVLFILAPIIIMKRIEDEREKRNTKAFLWGAISSTALMSIYLGWALVSGIQC